ncbi:helix-turn-helix domain-containing protein [Actinomadura sp. 3N407]|uniref:helix-turn-helix domain-containing protein n=1 Tax=Actinomadura sp. 3N407 TaxID=3457423 RepID=UPI003FCCCE75
MLNWERNVVRPGHRFPRHAHADWSVAVVRAGTGFIHLDGALHEAGPGAITVLHPGEAHHSRAHPEEGLDYVVITCTEAMAAGLHGHRATPRFTDHVIDDPECAAALLAACEAADVRDKAVELAAPLARLFHTHARGERATVRRSPVVRALRDYLEDHYAVPLSRNDMARLTHVSPATLARHFREDLGIAPHEYVLSRRIDAARALLRSDRSLPEIAQLTGFADQSHLHRHFTRIVGVTPGRFRRR